MRKENQSDDVERQKGKFDPVRDKKIRSWQLLTRLQYVPSVTQ